MNQPDDKREVWADGSIRWGIEPLYGGWGWWAEDTHPARKRGSRSGAQTRAAAREYAETAAKVLGADLSRGRREETTDEKRIAALAAAVNAGAVPRDPNRIEPMLASLRAVWQAHPDWRLGQLIVNAGGQDDPFYIEDDDLKRGLESLTSETKR